MVFTPEVWNLFWKWLKEYHKGKTAEELFQRIDNKYTKALSGFDAFQNSLDNFRKTIDDEQPRLKKLFDDLEKKSRKR